MHLSKPTYSYKSVALFSPKFVLNPNDMAGLLTYDVAFTRLKSNPSQKSPMVSMLSTSNTVMAVVPESNRIPSFFY